MRFRIRAIHLIPVFLVLLIGAAVGAYYVLFKPQMEKVAKARADWLSAQKALEAVEGSYQKAFDDRKKFAQQVFDGYYKFKVIANVQPQIYNMKEMYAANPKEGLKKWYMIMGTGQLIAELTRWAKSFKQPKTPTFTYTGTLGYEDTLPGVKMVEVAFGQQSFTAVGFTELLNKIRANTGYSYFPLIIDSAETDKTFTVTVDRKHPKHTPAQPHLSMSYIASAYFFTRGWNPGGAGAEDEAKKATEVITSTAGPEPPRKEFTAGPCPKVLWYFEQQGLKP